MDKKIEDLIESEQVSTSGLKKTGVAAQSITVFAVLLSLFQLYTGHFGVYHTAIVHRAIHLLFVLVLFFSLKPIRKGHELGVADKLLNTVLIGILLISLGNIVLFYDDIAERIGDLEGLTKWNIAMGIALIIVLLEAIRRVSLIFFILMLLAIVYMYFGAYFPPPLTHPGIHLERLIYLLVYSTEGIFGIGLAVSSTYLFLFILFGVFMEQTGVTDFFVDFAKVAVGRYRGGPAKVAVVASSLMGTVMGSSIANTASTGAFTIPLMKKSGFKPHVAGAVEAVASTGGQFLPPVMGAGAFIMAQVTGIPYANIALAALIPALLFYVCVFAIVHFEAVKCGMKGFPDEKGTFKKLLLKAHMLLPLVALVYFLIIAGYTATKASIIGILACVIVGNLKRKGRPKAKTYVNVLEKGAMNAVVIAVLCAGIGIVISSVILTGLGMKLATIAMGIAGNKVFILLLLVMAMSLIMGMGLPTPVAYLLMAIFAAPSLIQMGVPVLAAHLFIFYFSIMSGISPPIAIVAVVAAGIAKADWIKTAMTGLRFASISFIIPFMFVYSPQLFMVGSWASVLLALTTGLLGSIAMASSIQGIFFTKISLFKRVILFFAALTLIKSGHTTDIIGIIAFLSVIAADFIKNRKNFCDDKTNFL